jgi:hypothetical protein
MAKPALMTQIGHRQHQIATADAKVNANTGSPIATFPAANDDGDYRSRGLLPLCELDREAFVNRDNSSRSSRPKAYVHFLRESLAPHETILLPIVKLNLQLVTLPTNTLFVSVPATPRQQRWLASRARSSHLIRNKIRKTLGLCGPDGTV